MSISSISLSNRFFVRGPLLAAILASAPLIWPAAGVARAVGPFAGFAGSWHGSGQVVGTDGKRERITCRAEYSIQEGGAALSQSLVCASDSYRVDIGSYAVASGHDVQGHWQEATRQVQGNLTGQITDGNFEGNVAGPGFTAQTSIRTAGRKQEVKISPKGGDVAEVDIVLSRKN
jgi:hypothetical protein